MTLYGEREGVVRPILQIAMPRLPRLYAPWGTMHVVARCNNREFYFAAPEDFEILLDHLGEMSRPYGVLNLDILEFRDITNFSKFMEIKKDGRMGWWEDGKKADQSGGKKINPDNLQNGLVDLFHQFRFQIGDGAGCDSPVVDCPDLVDEQIGIPDQLFAGFDPDAERLCIVDEICRQGDDDRGWMSRIQKGLILKNENGSRFPRLRPLLRVEICQPDRSMLNSRGHVPPR
jgi:hypothetical protein